MKAAAPKRMRAAKRRRDAYEADDATVGIFRHERTRGRTDEETHGPPRSTRRVPAKPALRVRTDVVGPPRVRCAQPVERTLDELITRDGAYADLWESQAEKYLETAT